MLKKSLFTIILLVGFSFVAIGQTNNPPPKENPPVVPIKPKETPKPAPKPTPKPNLTFEIVWLSAGQVKQI